MSHRRAGTRSSAVAASEQLKLRRPLLVEPPPGQREQLLSALRTLFREHLEERLAFSPQSSVDPASVDVEHGR